MAQLLSFLISSLSITLVVAAADAVGFAGMVDIELQHLIN
jgi:hypothetical protein